MNNLDISKIKVKNELLDKNTFFNIKNILYSNTFQWGLTECINVNYKNSYTSVCDDIDNYIFSTTFYGNNKIFLLRRKAEQQRKNIRHERYEYFSGKADPEVYVENPFPKKIRDKDTMQKYLDADTKLSNTSLKIDYYDTMLVYLESILKVIQNRTYQIKNAIEFMRFQSGLG